ncbi:Solute carrier family 22 member 15 [Chionoecetes opilio]|uniref:Solute carrier family 22 member 15 n=1 Tax=Chionoecetes opilio TaxID=41210 RepID=A0A8J4Y9U4_CHIOP|nr:Solute carrier family 22 member 15 [Chionoecetes opilio]
MRSRLGPVWPKVVASLVAKGTSTASYQLAYLLTGELYPTGVRSLAISLASAFSSIGAAVSSYLNDLLVAVVWWGPAAVYGVLSLAAALLTAVLPETTLRPLPDTVEDTRTLGNAG